MNSGADVIVGAVFFGLAPERLLVVGGQWPVVSKQQTGNSKQETANRYDAVISGLKLLLSDLTTGH